MSAQYCSLSHTLFALITVRTKFAVVDYLDGRFVNS